MVGTLAGEDTLPCLQQCFWECILQKGILNKEVSRGGQEPPSSRDTGLWADLLGGDSDQPGTLELAFQEWYLS